ncbi:MAG: LamG-like jellyroll fold domain-containing protein [Pirellulales bacterium]
MLSARLSDLAVTLLCLCALGCIGATSAAAAGEKALLAHWALTGTSSGNAGDVKDLSGGAYHLVNHGATLVSVGQDAERVEALEFDGRDDFLELPGGLPLGSDPFTVAVWIHTDGALTDVLGDIASQFDPAARRGFHLSLLCNHGVTSSQSNYRNVHFGIDAGSEPGEWTDHGRLGDAILIYSMAVHDGQLFAGTCVADPDAAGRVFRFDGNAWFDCGAPDRANAISSMAVCDGALYVGTGKYRLRGSSLAESENRHPGGVSTVTSRTAVGSSVDVSPTSRRSNGMVVFGGRLYATSMYHPAAFFRYDGDARWTALPTPDGKRTEALGVYNGQIYATGYDEGAVYRFDGEGWEDLGVLDGATQTYGFAVHEGRLFTSEWPNARVFRLSGADDATVWKNTGQLGEELETMPLVVYNGKLYGGTLPNAEVYRYDGDDEWRKIARLDFTPDVRYRRVWSMAVYQGRLFAGTLPGGHVHSVEIGRNVTSDRALAPGWRHIAAVRDDDQLRLYVDGKLTGVSAPLDGEEYDLAADQPLRVGFGANDYFNGRMRDLRVYRGALAAERIAELASPDGFQNSPQPE